MKLKDETPFFIRPYPMWEEQKKVIQKEMDRLEHLGIIQKGLTSYSSPVVLVKWKNQNLYRVCSDFRILNEKLENQPCIPISKGLYQTTRSKMLSLLEYHRFERCISYLVISSFISKILPNYTILWFTHIPLPLNGYGYERESTDLAIICRSCIPR